MQLPVPRLSPFEREADLPPAYPGTSLPSHPEPLPIPVTGAVPVAQGTHRRSHELHHRTEHHRPTGAGRGVFILHGHERTADGPAWPVRAGHVHIRFQGGGDATISAGYPLTVTRTVATA